MEGPVADGAAGDVAGADGDVGAFVEGVEEPGQVGGVVGAVGVHFDDGAVAVFAGPGERGEVGGPEALFLGAVEDVDALVGLGEGVGDVAGAVG